MEAEPGRREWGMSGAEVRAAGGGEQAAGGSDAPPRLLARDLFGVRREILIEHLGQIYRLRITANEKLILTK
jgi:hemin uptake protein HemP